MREYKNIKKISIEECTGCKSCEDVCTERAISFDADNEGFWFPKINEEKCVYCGKCFSKCPLYNKGLGRESGNIEEVLNNQKEYNMPLETYAAWDKDDNERRNSTSGGIFSVFAHNILSRNGYVVGSAYSVDFRRAFHTVAEKGEELNKLLGSKYFQSDTGGIYKRTKELIQTDKPVLFVGTPCQVSALYSYLNQRPNNLLTVDFVCRGVSSPKVQARKIDHYEKVGHSKVKYYRDKYKKYAWIDFGARIIYENGKEKFVSRWRDEILHCFIMKNLNLRRSCYNCKFKLGHMLSDITMGDFWQIDGVTEKDLRYGVSSLMVNTKHGKEFLNKCRKKLYLKRKPLERVVAGNPAYKDPPDRPKERENFFRGINKYGIERTLKKYKDFRAETEKQKCFHEKRMRQRPWRFLWDERTEIDWLKFLKYNWFCKSVIREKDAFLVPYKGAVIDLAKNSRIKIKANILVNHYPAYPRGKQAALLQLRENAKAQIDNTVELAYGCTLSVAENAKFRTGYLTMMINTQIICHKEMKFGNNIMMGRDICVFDSDYHRIFDKEFHIANEDKTTTIGDNVWIGTKSMILKNTHIGNDVIIGADTFVSGNIPDGVVYTNHRTENTESDFYGTWER